MQNTKEQQNILPENVIEFEGESYEWQRQTFKLTGDERSYNHEDAMADQGVIRRLLQIEGQSVLKKLF